MNFGAPHDSVVWLIFLIVRWLEEIYDHVRGLLPVYIVKAGFDRLEEVACYRTIAGVVILYHASTSIHQK
ncbi:MAG TPA: hypothetical protein PKD88_06375 [Nitrosomonas sp.]|nr:hypothetical protein [Nitrosomonas sp.]HMY61365.1 hypothetical protein [Nitrosomonas sp.]HMY90096.1 hypothetical protein [Nitrosomonas sp.]HNA71276.1 hypothetical protein [Nitrosomonas sp.]HNB00254.1 hypothetical protein [Nitrosomonas sp.]